MIVPHSPEIERAVIGQLLLEAELLRKSGLREEDFHGGTSKRIFQAMENLFRKGQGFDLPLLAENLRPEDFQNLNELSGEVFTTGNFPLHVAALKDLSSKRRLQAVCAEAASKIHDKEFEEVFLGVRQGLSEIMNGQEGTNSISAAEMASHGWEWVEQRAQRRNRLSGIPCGLKSLDDHLDGFQNSELTIIAGRPGQGKTAFALHCLLAAARAGFTGAFLSLEMGQVQIENRLLSNLSRIPLWKIRKGHLGVEDWDKVTTASNALSTLPFRFIFAVRDLRSVISSMINLVETKGTRLLIVDYLQLIRVVGAQNREREISMISGELKSLAVSLRVPIIALSQLNRKAETRDDRKPGLADLRDSGSLEQDADNVLLLYRDDITESNGPIEFIVAKGRNIGGGIFHGLFDGTTQRFTDGDKGEEGGQ